MKVLNVLIVGAGIGGLTHALCLSLAGHRVTILEANPSAEFLGAGIQISPNATKVLQSIGLGPALARAATVPEHATFRHWRTGANIHQTRLGSVDKRTVWGALLPSAAIRLNAVTDGCGCARCSDRSDLWGQGFRV